MKTYENYPRSTQDFQTQQIVLISPTIGPFKAVTHADPPGLCSRCGAMRGPMKTLLACSDALPQQNERGGSSFVPVVDMDVRQYISISNILEWYQVTLWAHPFLCACTQMFTLSIRVSSCIYILAKAPSPEGAWQWPIPNIDYFRENQLARMTWNHCIANHPCFQFHS